MDQKPHVENLYQTTTSVGTANIEAEDVVVNENICDGTTVECTESSSTKANNGINNYFYHVSFIYSVNFSCDGDGTNTGETSQPSCRSP